MDELLFRRFQRNLREGKARIKIASQDGVNNYELEIDEILRAVGHEEALVTDESRIGDFFSIVFHRIPLTKQIIRRKQQEQKLSKKLKIPVSLHDLIIDVAQRLRTYRGGE